MRNATSTWARCSGCDRGRSHGGGRAVQLLADRRARSRQARPLRFATASSHGVQDRLIEDTPTSRVRSAAQGYVEVAGLSARAAGRTNQRPADRLALHLVALSNRGAAQFGQVADLGPDRRHGERSPVSARRRHGAMPDRSARGAGLSARERRLVWTRRVAASAHPRGHRNIRPRDRSADQGPVSLHRASLVRRIAAARDRRVSECEAAPSRKTPSSKPPPCCTIGSKIKRRCSRASMRITTASCQPTSGNSRAPPRAARYSPTAVSKPADPGVQVICGAGRRPRRSCWRHPTANRSRANSGRERSPGSRRSSPRAARARVRC